MLRARWEIRAFRNVERLADYEKIKARRQRKLTRTDATALRGRTRRWRSLSSEKNKTTIIAVGTVVIVFLTVALLVVALLLQKPLCQPFAGDRIPLVSRAPLPQVGNLVAVERGQRQPPRRRVSEPGRNLAQADHPGGCQRLQSSGHQAGREYRTIRISALRQYRRTTEVSTQAGTDRACTSAARESRRVLAAAQVVVAGRRARYTGGPSRVHARAWSGL